MLPIQQDPKGRDKPLMHHTSKQALFRTYRGTTSTLAIRRPGFSDALITPRISFADTIRAAILSLHATAHRASSLEADLTPAPAFGHSQIATDTPSSDVRDLYFFVDGSRVMGMRVSSNQGGGKVRAQVFAGSTESLPGYNNGPRLRAMFHEPAGVTELGGSLYIADTSESFCQLV